MVDSDQRHHQPARAERRHRRRLDAGDDPHLGPHVGPGRQGGRHPRRHPRQQLRRHLPGRHRRLPRQRRLRPDDDGLGAQRRPHGAGGRGVRQPRQDVRDRRPPARCASSTRPATVLLEHSVGAGDIWRVCQTKDVPIRDWVKLAVTRARASRHAGGVLARRDAAPTTPTSSPRSSSTSPEHDTDGLQIEIMAPADAMRVLARAHPPGRGHHLGHRQRAARLPHRPVPDPRARHQRQDALDRPADQRRRPVRDRRRRLGAQARAAAASRRTTCAGTASASSSRSPRSLEHLATSTDNARAQSWPTRSTAPPARSSTRTSRRAARLGEIDNRGSHFYLALYWAQELAAQTEDAELAARVRRARRRRSPPTSRRSPTSCSPCRARRSTSAATTAPTTTRPSDVMRPSKTFNEVLAKLG